MAGYVEKDDKGQPMAWKQKIKGTWRRLPYVAGYTPERAAEEFESMYPFIQRECVEVAVSDALFDEILNDFIPRWIIQKKKERWIGALDPDSLLKRSLSGFLGEAVMESFLGVPVLDRGKDGRIAVGDSRNFAGADLAKGTGLDIGVKSSAAPNFPTPRRNVRRPQVICMRTGMRSFYVGGYASMKTLRSYMMSALVLNDKLRNKRLNNLQLEKSAFFGFHELIQFRSVEELREVYYKHR